MKHIQLIVPLFILLVACTTKALEVATIQHLTNGTYYFNPKQSNDTLRFQKEKYDKGNWNNTIWNITNDSIFQEDSRSLSFHLGKDKRKYQLKNDTLTIWTNRSNQKGKWNNQQLDYCEKYLVLLSDKNQLVLVDLNKNETQEPRQQSRTGIQLR